MDAIVEILEKIARHRAMKDVVVHVLQGAVEAVAELGNRYHRCDTDGSSGAVPDAVRFRSDWAGYGTDSGE